MNFWFQFFITLSTSLIIRIKSILMIEMHKNCDYILDKTQTLLFKQKCKQCDFLANGVDLMIDEKLD